MGVLHEKVAAPLDIRPFHDKKSDLDSLPDLHELATVEDKALWCLVFSKDKVGVPYLSAQEVAVILADVFEVRATESAVRMALGRAGGKVNSRNFGPVNKFAVMAAGRESLNSHSRDRAFVVDPARQHTAILRIAQLLGELKGVVRICDPYMDSRTLEILAMVPDSCSIRFMTMRPKDVTALARHIKAYRAQHGNLDVRALSSREIHDRYILTAREFWLVGHSLNCIGSKQTFVVKLGEDILREIEQWFDTNWATAEVLS